MVFPLIWEALLSHGAPTSTQHSTPNDTDTKSATDATALQQHRASRIFAVMLLVSATYALLSVCIVLWSNNAPTRVCRLPFHQSHAADDAHTSSHSAEDQRSHHSTAQNAAGMMMCRLSSKWRTLIKWHLLRNRDFLVVAAAHTTAYASQSVPDINFYSLVERHYEGKSGLSMVREHSIQIGVQQITSVNCRDAKIAHQLPVIIQLCLIYNLEFISVNFSLLSNSVHGRSRWRTEWRSS